MYRPRLLGIIVCLFWQELCYSYTTHIVVQNTKCKHENLKLKKSISISVRNHALNLPTFEVIVWVNPTEEQYSRASPWGISASLITDSPVLCHCHNARIKTLVPFFYTNSGPVHSLLYLLIPSHHVLHLCALSDGEIILHIKSPS